MEFFIAESSDTSIPLNLTLEQEGVGGITGKSPTVALRDGSTSSSYFDWADGLFKTSGWTMKNAVMAEVGNGHYIYILNAAVAGTIIPGLVLVAEFHVDDGSSVIGVDHDTIRIVASIDDIPGDISGGGGTGGVLVVNGEVYNFNEWVTEITLPQSGTQAQRLIEFDTETRGFGKVYIESNLSVIYVQFGDLTVNADSSIASIRLVGGAPWAIATRGHTHMSVYASADISIRVRGLVPV